MGIEARVEGIDNVLKNFESLIARVDTAAQNFVEKGSVTIASNAKREFRGRPKGSVRVSKQSGQTWYDNHPPFEPRRPKPTNRSGELQKNIKRISSTRLGLGRWESMTGPTGTSEMYGWRVEALGFHFMSTGMEHSRPELNRIYEQEMAKAIKG